MKDSFSILIPVYNFDITNLVESLYSQAISLNIDFEILIVDDKSEEYFITINHKLSKKKQIDFILLEKNIGRTKIRNLLFKKAKYENCLIMDCDVEIISNHFLLNYLEKLDNNIVVGGHVYSKNPPTDKSTYFHWLYGNKVEVQNIKTRIKKPYLSFMTNCFATTKTTFNKTTFNEEISQYGHEDTLFGIALKESKIPITHILNPVKHIGLDNEKIFYQKQEKAIENLAKLYSLEKYHDKLSDIKLIKFYKSPLKYMLGIIKLFSKIKTKEKQSLINFSLWKLEMFNKYYKK